MVFVKSTLQKQMVFAVNHNYYLKLQLYHLTSTAFASLSILFSKFSYTSPFPYFVCSPTSDCLSTFIIVFEIIHKNAIFFLSEPAFYSYTTILDTCSFDTPFLLSFSSNYFLCSSSYSLKFGHPVFAIVIAAALHPPLAFIILPK